ncbi:MAG TPA: outer membrane lipoprotein-sorting protein [Desulfomonilaceae bacterium]|nr:outer membrane lipoprotein-sorting protein [Desulfomonilaceae bacterium]
MSFPLRRLFLLVFTVFLPLNVYSMTAHEILERVAKETLTDSFRISLAVQTFRGQKLKSKHVLWFMGRMKDDVSKIFIEFEEPKESKGLRFLFEIRPTQESAAFMYLPATRRTLPLAMDDPSVDLGGTGLTMDDIQGFMPQSGEEEAVLKEEKVDGRDCYVIRIILPKGKGERLVWVSKKDFIVVKAQNTDAHGKVVRSFRVTEFFKTENGKEFPREEEISIPAKNTKIRLRQESAVFGTELPDEITDSEKFGTFKWKN